ncbi:hypothetical protein [Yinghuangia seranimata]|uniref:hypothetical protein n=1 Tax=Yinghuangia seranimata TaxID=408067 RepID=UPI00248BB00B|nr:hypothetical protein [Yinghuangia seranimata]MDI2126714.1 hypothetical protein [Yinghuangia seranimata]
MPGATAARPIDVPSACVPNHAKSRLAGTTRDLVAAPDAIVGGSALRADGVEPAVQRPRARRRPTLRLTREAP